MQGTHNDTWALQEQPQLPVQAQHRPSAQSNVRVWRFVTMRECASARAAHCALQLHHRPRNRVQGHALLLQPLPRVRRHVRTLRLPHPRRRLRRQSQRGLRCHLGHRHAASHTARHHAASDGVIVLPPPVPAARCLRLSHRAQVQCAVAINSHVSSCAQDRKRFICQPQSARWNASPLHSAPTALVRCPRQHKHTP